ncbi:MAG: ABC transporter ATP-binding protein [Spirochaetales bacterium]|nr:ABC transporter ATP-binding protein [Spirochaetales bacterium]
MTGRDAVTAIEAQGLTKVFGNGVRAVSDLTLRIEGGKIFGFLGPNGSGKTTTVRLLNGTLTPTAGGSRVLGLESRSEEIRRRTATLAEEARMYEHMSVLDNLRFFASMYDLRRPEAEGAIRTLLERMGLWEKRSLTLGSFSTGMKKRVYLSRTLLHQPEILFLDEPTSGLDPEGATQVTDLIRALAREQGTTVFLCTHNLFLAERICDGFGFIRAGELVAAGTRDELIRQSTERPEVEIRTERGTERFAYGEEVEIDSLVRRVQAQGKRIIEVRPLRPTLEEVYFRTIGRNHELE